MTDTTGRNAVTQDPEHSTVHGTFVLEHTYPAAPERVFAAWTSAQAKTRWFVSTPEGGGITVPLSLDFQVGGTELLKAAMADGTEYTYQARYEDIVPGERIVATTQMYKDEQRISVSVTTVELAPAGDGTRLTLTEQGTYLDGLDEPKWREAGTRRQLDALGERFQ